MKALAILNLSVVMATFRNHSEHGAADMMQDRLFDFLRRVLLWLQHQRGQKYTQKCLVWKELEKRSAEMEMIRLVLRLFFICFYHNYYYYTATGSLNVSVGIATRLRAGRPRN
jgi:hypothetical protein